MRIRLSSWLSSHPFGPLYSSQVILPEATYTRRDYFLQLQSKHVVIDDTGRAAKNRVSGELTLEKAFGGCLCI